VRQEGTRSEVRLPGYVEPPELAANRPAVPATAQGTLTREMVDSEFLGETRTAFVYTPALPASSADGTYPTLYVNDGSAYLNEMKATAVLDWLIYHEEIAPIVVVFVPAINRTAEYGQPTAYNQFLWRELRPLVERNYGVSARGEDTAVLGSGLGGFAALEAALGNPTAWGKAASHSADPTATNQALSRRRELPNTPPVQVHLGVGLFETAVPLLPLAEPADLLVANQALAQTLQSKGFPFRLTERAEGHNWGQWGAQFGTAVRYFFPPAP
jgi:enterochelin esterase-like enzyme